VLSVSASVSPASACLSTSDGSPTNASIASLPKANGFAIELFSLLQSGETLNKSQTGTITAAGDAGSSLPTAEALAAAVATTANATAKQKVENRSRTPERILLSGGPSSFSTKATARTPGSPQVDGSTKDTTPQPFATACDVAFSQSMPTVFHNQGTLAPAVSLSGNAGSIASGQSTTLSVPLPVRQASGEPIQSSSPPSLLASSAIQLDPNAQAPSGQQDRTDGPALALARGLASETSFHSVPEGGAASLGDAPEAASIEQELPAARPELAFGARLKSAELPVQLISDAGQPEALAASLGRDASKAAELQAAASGAVAGARAGVQSSATFERSHDGQNGSDSQRSPFNETGTPQLIPSGDQTATASATPSTTTAAPQVARFNPLEDESASGSKAPMRELSLRVAGDGTQSADVRLVERNGEIQVAVRASDPRLTESLRSNVNELVNSLSRSELNAEIWHPGVAAEKSMLSDARQDSSGRAPSSEHPDADSSHSGQRENGREGRKAPEWLEEIDAIPTRDSARRNTSDSKSLF
jgi:hypothetical protein